MSKKYKALFIRVLAGLLSIATVSTVLAAKPLWTFTPIPGSQPTQTVPENATTLVQYIVQNQSSKSKRLVIKPIHSLRSTRQCNLAPKGQDNSSCMITLIIRGSTLSAGGVHGGPVLCQANPDNSPNPNQCYQPSRANSLNITRGPAVNAMITASPSNLSFVAGSSGAVTVTNNATSTEAARNVAATIPAGSNITVQSTTCGVNLAAGASCTITFTSPVAEGPVNIAISGSNTNTSNVEVTVTPVPMAIISVNPSSLMFTEGATGVVTVTNTVSSPVAADNVTASIPGGSNISVQSTTCGASLAIGASCTITFTSNAQEGPTSIPIAGDNTNTVNVNVTVIANQAQISITAPTMENRVVGVGANSLSLIITNDAGSAVNATLITVSDHSGCSGLIVNDGGCTSVAPGDSCTLILNSNAPYIPCLISISGSNTANTPTTLIAFSYLGGLVFEESGGVGKVVADMFLEFSSMWTSTYSDIAGATSLDDGVGNTDAIVGDPACLGDQNNCVAQRCRDLGAQWYSPARNEMSTVYDVLCSNGSIPCNFGGFSNAQYWSSSQDSNNGAWVVFFPGGGITAFFKDTSHPARCVQSFP